MYHTTIIWYASTRGKKFSLPRKREHIGLENRLVHPAGWTTTEWALLVVDVA